MRSIVVLFWSLFIFVTHVAFAKHVSTFKASPELIKQIKIIALGEGQIQDSFRVSARIDLDQQHVARIGAAVTGRINETAAILGQDVLKGERLALLNSNELAEAQAVFLKTSSQVNLRQLAVNRAQRLLDNGVIATANLHERIAALEESLVDLRTATDHLQALGLGSYELTQLSKHKVIHSILPITSSIQGTIVERNVTVGQVIQPADSLFTVADLSHVWIIAELPEQQSSWAHKGDEAQVTIPAITDVILTGQLNYVSDIVDPKSRTVTVRMELPNPKRDLKPNMLANLLIRKRGVQELILPDSAVIRVHDKDHVFKEVGSDEFELIPVKLGNHHDNVRPVISGLKLGDRVVIEGGFHLNSELQSKKLE